MRLTDFKALTVDCYGTLIDWEPASSTRCSHAMLASFARHEIGQEGETRHPACGAEPVSRPRAGQRRRAALASDRPARRCSGSGSTPPPPAGVRYDFRFTGVAELVEAHRDALRG
jgi:hypothetical protein